MEKKNLGIFRKDARRKPAFLGKAFFDMVVRFDRSRRRFFSEKDRFSTSWQEVFIVGNLRGSKPEFKVSVWRILPLYLFTFTAIFFLTSRLVQLQVIEGHNFLSASEGNRSLTRVIHAPRGVVYDRNGNVLASNIPAFRVVLDGSALTMEEKISLSNKLSLLLELSEEEVKEKVESVGNEVFTIKDGVNRDVALKIEAMEGELKGVSLEVDPVRQYNFGSLLSHVIGFTGEISKEELSNSKHFNYRPGDKVGVSGIEKTFEQILRGVSGQEIIKVDANGKKTGVLASVSPIPGEDLILSLDLDLQKEMEKALRDKLLEVKSSAGVVVAQNPKTGEILGMISLPSYDNNLFAKGISWDDYDLLMNDKNKPMLNRAVSAAYPPGSTFKVVTAAAGLENGKISKETKIEDTGEFFLGEYRFTNWYYTQYGKKEGFIDVVRALARSNDTFFYHLGERIGEKALENFARLFGFGEKLGVDLLGESSGLVPNEEWKLKTLKEPWYPGNTINMSIGQGDLTATPLQVNAMMGVVANGGKLIKPTLIKKIRSEVIRENFVSVNSLTTLKEGLREAVVSGGTAWPFFDFKVPVAGKTGTAETGESSDPHAWFTVFAPYEEPEIVVTVFIENGGEGSSVAAPVARKILEYYFNVK
jgi:penicillin-binding protein 2